MITNNYEAIIRKVAAEFDIDPDLVARQIEAESSFKPDARSECGAVGLMQLMPTTALDYGVTAERLLDPETNIRTGLKHLRMQYDRFRGVGFVLERWQFALAAYNCGGGYISKALALNGEARKRMPTMWDLVKCYLMHPDCVVSGRRPDAVQTIQYVWRIWAGYQADLKQRGMAGTA